MDGIGSLVQSGGNDMVGLLNQSGGTPVHLFILVLRILLPVIFFGVTYGWHAGLDKARSEKKSEEEGGLRSVALWGKFSVKVMLFMALLCLAIGWLLTGGIIDISGGMPWKWWWKIAFTAMSVTFFVSIITNGLRSSAYTYFVDELHKNPTKLKNTCVEFGCGYAPHGKTTCERGKVLD